MTKQQPKFNRVTALVISVLVALATVLGYTSFARLWEHDIIIPSPHVTAIKWLSDYFPPLKDSAGDTRIFIIDSGEPGGTVSVMGGTHPDETSGFMAALILVEKIQLTKGRLIVIPQCNNSAFTHSFPQEATPQFIRHDLGNGQYRSFRGGARGVNPIHYWPDPEVFSHYQTGQKLSGEEVRNLNRAYPGVENGTFAERVAFALTKVILEEKVDLNIDLHEAWPEYPFINAMGAHQKNADMATLAALEMRMEDVDIRVEMSPEKFRGLTYRELGDYTPAWTVLAETPGPGIGRIRGITDEKLFVEGKDAFYVEAARLGRTFIPYGEEGWPLNVRVARHLTTVESLCRVFSELNPEKPFSFANMPAYSEAAATPVGRYLNVPQ
ncbi:MAG: succinylglutamate desuccinylase/aspartoacylase family protein [Deltaproteobacteria bacterium]|jgi:hypothetical protein|nr:succinylglutamate desuccinylase/aspartoacylase family protein [Deltaproteobacteria bacterium]